MACKAARVIGHTMRIIPAQFVKPYVKSNKNDLVDAAAIAEAVTRPSMRFVQAKSTEQVELQTRHRIRDRLVGSKAQLINQMRAFCLKFGIAIRHGVGAFKGEFPRILVDDTNDLTLRMRELLTMLFAELADIEIRIADITRKIEAVARHSRVCSASMRSNFNMLPLTSRSCTKSYDQTLLGCAAPGMRISLQQRRLRGPRLGGSVTGCATGTIPAQRSTRSSRQSGDNESTDGDQLSR